MQFLQLARTHRLPVYEGFALPHANPRGESCLYAGEFDLNDEIGESQVSMYIYTRHHCGSYI